MNAAALLKRRPPPLQKVPTDVERLKNSARFVILLSEEGIRLIDNRHLRENKKPFARLIAVIAPALFRGKWMQEALVMEIAYSRARPYKRIEVVLGGPFAPRPTQRWVLPQRTQIRFIREEELAQILPLLNDCFAQIVLENRESWKVKGEYEVRRISRYNTASGAPGYFTDRGIRFTFDRSDKAMCQQVLLEDLRYRKERYIVEHARILGAWVPGTFGRYTDREFAKLPDVQSAAELLERYKKPLYLKTLYDVLPERVRAAIDRVRAVFKHRVRLNGPEVRLASSTPSVKIPEFTSVHCYIDWQERALQARDCIVAEFVLERRFREANEIDDDFDTTPATEHGDDEIPF